MLFKEIIAVCSELHAKHKCNVWAKRRIFEWVVVHIVTTVIYGVNTRQYAGWNSEPNWTWQGSKKFPDLPSNYRKMGKVSPRHALWAPGGSCFQNF
jgi:hypothetical protein